MLGDEVIRNFVQDGKLNLTVGISPIENWQNTNPSEYKPKLYQWTFEVYVLLLQGQYHNLRALCGIASRNVSRRIPQLLPVNQACESCSFWDRSLMLSLGSGLWKTFFQANLIVCGYQFNQIRIFFRADSIIRNCGPFRIIGEERGVCWVWSSRLWHTVFLYDIILKMEAINSS
jgi:hypothetical protein